MCVAAASARVAALLLGTVTFFAVACESPPPVAYVPGVGEIMTLNQNRHIKLWYAGEAENWPLAAYEVGELEEGFADVARFHPVYEGAPRPLSDLIRELVAMPLRQLRTVVLEKDRSSFVAAYDSLTDACNACHEATGFSFNVIARPASNPYSDQLFRLVR